MYIKKVYRYCVEIPGIDWEADDRGEKFLGSEKLSHIERVAAATILLNIRNVEPEIFKYGRKALGLSQLELAKVLGEDQETIEKFETGRKSIKYLDQLAMVFLLKEAILYRGLPEKYKKHVNNNSTYLTVS